MVLKAAFLFLFSVILILTGCEIFHIFDSTPYLNPPEWLLGIWVKDDMHYEEFNISKHNIIYTFRPYNQYKKYITNFGRDYCRKPRYEVVEGWTGNCYSITTIIDEPGFYYSKTYQFCFIAEREDVMNYFVGCTYHDVEGPFEFVRQ